MEIKNCKDHVYIKFSKNDVSFSKDIQKIPFQKQHLIIDLTQVHPQNEEILSLERFILLRKNKGFSVVFICQDVNYELFDEGIFNLVCTYLEARDTLEMEAISRDLGF